MTISNPGRRWIQRHAFTHPMLLQAKDCRWTRNGSSFRRQGHLGAVLVQHHRGGRVHHRYLTPRSAGGWSRASRQHRWPIASAECESAVMESGIHDDHDHRRAMIWVKQPRRLDLWSPPPSTGARATRRRASAQAGRERCAGARSSAGATHLRTGLVTESYRLSLWRRTNSRCVQI